MVKCELQGRPDVKIYKDLAKYSFKLKTTKSSASIVLIFISKAKTQDGVEWSLENDH